MYNNYIALISGLVLMKPCKYQSVFFSPYSINIYEAKFLPSFKNIYIYSIKQYIRLNQQTAYFYIFSTSQKEKSYVASSPRM